MMRWGSRFIVFILFIFTLASLDVKTAHAGGEAPPPGTTTQVNNILEEEGIGQVESSEPGQAAEMPEGLQTGEDQGAVTETPPTEDIASEPLLDEGQGEGPVSPENPLPPPGTGTTASEETPPAIDRSAETTAPEDGESVEESESPAEADQPVPVEEPAADPYFTVDGTQHSFLPEGGDCAGAEHCQVSATPIQDALEAVSGGLVPNDHTIYFEGGEYREDIRIDSHENLILQGSAGQRPTIITGSISITNSSNILLCDLRIEGMISIRDSADVSIGENITVAGRVDSLQVELSGGDLLAGEQTSQVEGSLRLKGKNVTVRGDLSADEIYIQSSDTTYVSGNLSAPGGTVHILGERVALIEDARVDVSGPDGGGTVLVGGDYRGQGSVPNAQQAYVGPETVIRADALDNGDGGYVIVWADKTTQFYGTISAKGGPAGGNGGFIETSGREFLEVSGASVSASAPRGQAGTWLMDPRDVEIKNAATANGAFNGGAPNVFTPTADSAVVNVTDIQNSLNSGTSVTITTGSTGTQPGNITLTDPIIKNTGGDATLTLEAANDIILNATIQPSAGKLNIILSADADKNQSGIVNVLGTILTNGGSLTIQGVDVNISHLVNANTGAILLEPSVNSINSGIGTGAVATFYLTDAELAWLGGLGGLTIGQSGGDGDFSIGTVTNISGMNVVIRGRNITFDGTLAITNGSLQINASGAVIDNNGAALDIQLTAGGPYLLVDSAGAFGSSADPIETQASNLAAELDSGGIFITNTGALTIDWFARLDGQTDPTGFPIFITGLTATNGDISLQTISMGNITIGQPILATGAGSVNILPADDLIVNNTVTSVSGDISLTPTYNVQFSGSGDVSSISGNISIVGGYGGFTYGAITMDADTVIDAGSGKIYLLAIDDSIYLGRLVTTNTGTDAIKVIATWSIVDNGDIGGANIQTGNGGGVLLSGSSSVGASNNPIELQAGVLAGDGWGFFVTNAGPLEIGSAGGQDGITTTGNGITILTASPLVVSRAIRDNAGGNINLTAGNNPGVLGDNLTISANVETSGGNGRINLNAGDDIIVTSSGRVAAPSEINFNAGLDGENDGGGGDILINGIVELTGTGKINITATKNITLGTSSRIASNGGDTVLRAVNGAVKQEPGGQINLNGGGLGTAARGAANFAGTNSVSTLGSSLTGAGLGLNFSNNGPLVIGTVQDIGGITTNNGNVTVQAFGSITVNHDINVGSAELQLLVTKPDASLVVSPGVTLTASLMVLQASNISLNGTVNGNVNLLDPFPSTQSPSLPSQTAPATTLSVVNGQQVSLLDATALGSTLVLQLPDGNGAAFQTGLDALVSLSSDKNLSLPAPLPAGFVALSTMLIDAQFEGEAVSLGEILVTFGMPDDIAPDSSLVILHWDGSQWNEIPIAGLSADQISALAENGGYFVLATPAEKSGESVQAQLSGITEQPVTLQVGQIQVTVSGAAGDSVTITQWGNPGNLPAGMRFLDGLQVEITRNDAAVNILPVGESIRVAFGLPEGTEGNVTIMYWLRTLNSGQGGWTELEAQRSADGNLALETFFGGEFLLAAR